MVHDCGDLAILVTVHIDATVDGQSGEFVVLLVLLYVLRAEGTLEKHETVSRISFWTGQRVYIRLV